MSLSLKKSKQQAGGFLDDVDVTLTRLRFEPFDYNGNIPDPVPALKVTMTTEDGEEREQYYSAGSFDRVKIRKDGKALDPADESEAEGLSKSSKAGKFLASLMDAGFDEDKVDEEVDVFEDLVVHVQNKPWKGFNSKEGDTILLVTKIKGAGEEEAAPAKGKPAAGKGAKTGADSIKDKTAKLIVTLLETADKNKIPKSKISTLVFKAAKKDPDVKKMTELALDDEFLGADDQPFDFDGDTLIGR